MKRFLAASALIALASCGGDPAPESETTAAQPETAVAEPAAAAAPSGFAAILDAQPDEVKARYQYRLPMETMAFFGIEPGMTVVEALPGGGWYTRLLLPYLGAEGRVIGADYPLAAASEQSREAKMSWVADWTAEAESWRQDGDASVAAFQMGAMPESMNGSADAVLFIRALHGLARREAESGFLSMALDDAYRALKPGGIVGVVQHHARDDMPDEWADGSKGYLKKDYVIAKMESAGFELVDSSDMHANPKDQPTEADFVWRLPPSLRTSRDNPELEPQMRAIGESNRMTLKFQKPAP